MVKGKKQQQTELQVKEFKRLDEYYKKQQKCLFCKSKRIQKTIRGKPSKALLDYIKFTKQRDGYSPVILGGCQLNPKQKKFHCFNCSKNF